MPSTLDTIHASVSSFVNSSVKYGGCALGQTIPMIGLGAGTGALTGAAIGSPTGPGAMGTGTAGAIVGGIIGLGGGLWDTGKNCRWGDQTSLNSQHRSEMLRHHTMSPSSDYLQQSFAAAAGKGTLSPGQTVALAHAIRSHAPSVKTNGHAQLAMHHFRSHISKSSKTA